MLILHISDIHFRKTWCLRPALDRDRAIRTRLVQSVAEQVEKLGPVDAILITGDLAFGGDPLEYEFAKDWLLAELVPAARCDPSQIFTVPGNHDINRDEIEGDRAVRNVQDAIRRARPDRRLGILVGQIDNKATAQSLFQPLAAYNDFATRFNCQVYAPDRIYWAQDLKLTDHVSLRLYGLTSTLVSGAVNDNGKQDDVEGDLYLSPLQTDVIDPVPNVVNLVMAHHPPSWCADRDDIESVLPDRAMLQLFGHRHQQRVLREKYYMRFDAGALHPNRDEKGWSPCYNLIRLDVIGAGAERHLDIAATMMEWQVNPEQFKPRMDGAHDMYHHRIPVPDRGGAAIASPRPSPTVVANTTNTPVVGDGTAAAAPIAKAPTDVTIVLSERRTRNLMMRFWDLSSSHRYQIALDLGLISAADKAMAEPERYSRAFRRAGELGLFERLDEEVSKCQNNK